MKGKYKLIEAATLTVSTLLCVAIFGVGGGDNAFKLDFSSPITLPLQILMALPMLATIITFKLGIDDFVAPRVGKEGAAHPYHQVVLLASLLAMLGWALSGHTEVGIGGDTGGFPIFWTSGFVWFYCLAGAPIGCLVSLVRWFVHRRQPGPKFPWLSAITVFVLSAVFPAIGCLRETNPFG